MIMDYRAVRYYQDSEAAEKVKMAYFVLVVIVLSVWLLFLILFCVYQLNGTVFTLIHMIELSFSSVVQLLGSACFLFFGLKMWTRLEEISNPRGQHMQKMIKFLTIFETVMLAFRAIYLLLISFIPMQPISFGIAFTCYSVIFDLINPLVIMWLLGQKIPRTSGAKSYLINQSHTRGLFKETDSLFPDDEPF